MNMKEIINSRNDIFMKCLEIDNEKLLNVYALWILALQIISSLSRISQHS